ncbi:MAG: FixH family protein [Chitinophagales bacterium]|nr:FixH family protein [Chitinophagales bacterium]
MNKYFQAVAAILIAVFLFSSCKKENHNHNHYPIPSNLKLLASGYAEGSATRIDVYAADSFFSGYNSLYLALYDSASNERQTDADVTLMPMMSMMGGMNHSAPFENPATAKPADGLFTCAVVYIMPSSTGNTWKLNITVLNNRTGLQGTAALDVNVLQPSLSRMKSVTALDDSAKLFISIVKPFVPVVGVNDFEITIHKKASMMSFPAANDYTTEVNPQMLSMGHGSPLNVNPVPDNNGHYKGKLNFTMSGDWRVFLKLNHNGAVADSTLYFDVTIP